MLESLLLAQGKVIPPPVKGDITFKTSGTSATTITTSALGSGFTTEYSIDGSDFVTAGNSFSIPVGDHEMTLKLTVTAGTTLTMTPFKDILMEVVDWEDFQLPNIRFMDCAKLTKVPDYLPTSITSMKNMFRNCSAFKQPLNTWDTGNVTDMYGVFNGCSTFNQSLNNWNTSQVTDMRYMFTNCPEFDSSISEWDVSNVTIMTQMFQNCTAFNQDIGGWDVSKVVNILFMFQNCTSFNQDLSSMVFKSTVSRTGYDAGATAWDPAYRPKFTG